MRERVGERDRIFEGLFDRDRLRLGVRERVRVGDRERVRLRVGVGERDRERGGMVGVLVIDGLGDAVWD